MLLGARTQVRGFVFAGLGIEGLAYALINREGIALCLSGLQGLPSSAVALQAVFVAQQLAKIPGEVFAGNMPLFASLYLAPLLSLLLLAFLASPFPKWVARGLLWLARRE